MTSADLRARLRELGESRARHDQDSEELMTAIRCTLKLVDEDPEVSKSEAARLLGVHRTTLYRVYDT